MDPAVSTTTGGAPAITVLMSCYNSARWLDEAIASVLGQSFADFEFIIVNDGSTDESPAIIRRNADRDPRIVVIDKENSGLADSLNVGIRQARGDWIARIDADDLCEPTRLERQIARARQEAGCVYVGTGMTEIDENGALLARYGYPETHAELVGNMATLRKFPPHSSAFFRTATARALGGYRTRLKRSQDWDLWLRLCEHGSFSAVDEALVRIRKHAEQISHEESGRRQRVDTRVAVISYWIRRHGGADPVAGDARTFEDFRAWLQQRMEQKGLFDYLAYVQRTKALFAGMRRSPAAAFAVVAHLAAHPALSLRFLRTRLFGEAIPEQLAREWIRRQASARQP